MRTCVSILLFVALLGVNRVAGAREDIRVADEQLFARLDANGDGQLKVEELPSSQARLFARLVRQGDADDDGQLTKDEWQQAIAPRRPAKPIEEQRPAELPGADAVRLVLLKLDVDGDGVIAKDEAPSNMQRVYNQIAEQFDRNDDGRINRLELARGGPRITRIAQRAVRQHNWDVERELKKLDRQQGSAALRFSERSTPRQMLTDPNQRKALFEEFDRNGDGKIDRDEVPAQVQDRLGRLFRFGDRDRDGALSEKEFLTATERLGRFMQRMQRDN